MLFVGVFSSWELLLMRYWIWGLCSQFKDGSVMLFYGFLTVERRSYPKLTFCIGRC